MKETMKVITHTGCFDADEKGNYAIFSAKESTVAAAEELLKAGE